MDSVFILFSVGRDLCDEKILSVINVYKYKTDAILFRNKMMEAWKEDVTDFEIEEWGLN